MAKVLSAGGGTSAAAWATHGGCERFCATDPMVTGMSRRALAKELGNPDTSAKIPAARWTRAMIFERLCHDAAFAGEVAARATGWSGFLRPTAVTSVDCGVSPSLTADALDRAVVRADTGHATLLSQLAVPFPGLAEGGATNVLPDLAVVCLGPQGPSLIVGDVKDYERVRSNIDDGRLLRGFLQVAMGAYAFQKWSLLPTDLAVSSHGFLAVPRSAFLQPTVEVEDLRDHLVEVHDQVVGRTNALAELISNDDDVSDSVEHLKATFDPAACTSCSLFNHCRSELRASSDAELLLVEVGIPMRERASVAPLLRGQHSSSTAKASTAHRLAATLSGVAGNTGKLRVDCADRPGCVDVVAVKSDAAALGYHGIAVRRETTDGYTPWEVSVFEDPQGDDTRRKVMAMIGKHLDEALGDQTRSNPLHPDPVHVVVPDRATADLLASTADLLAGVELSRLRWARDKEMGRPALTFNGEPANVPRPLKAQMRRAVSFLLEHDRARMLKLRQPVVNLTEVLADHIIAGGARVLSSRLDYLVSWGDAATAVDHREVADIIEMSPHTPGARLANATSDAIHEALQLTREEGNAAAYTSLVTDELEYKTAVFDAALELLDVIPDSKLQPTHRSIEGAAQAVWRRRMLLQASDLVRFGRTYAYWRNQLVDVLQDDDRCSTQLAVLADPTFAAELAADAGNRDVTFATVVDVNPLTLDVASRRFDDTTQAVLITRNGDGWLETGGVSVKVIATSFQLHGFPKAPLVRIDDDTPSRFAWSPKVDPCLDVGDKLVLADLDSFDNKQTWFNVKRPRQDDQAAPKSTCTESSYDQDSATHQWCCKPHRRGEADYADQLALRRARGELNPEVWPPVRDEDGFEVTPNGKPTSRDVVLPTTEAPEGVTTDELE